MAVVIGEAAVAVRADASGTAEEIEKEVGPAAEKAGEDGGSKLGAKMTAAFGAALAIGEAFATSLENAALGDKLSAQLGATGQYAEDLGGIAGSLYADAYGESLGDVNDALRNVLQSGIVDEDATNAQIESVTGHVMDLATAMEQDVGGTTQAVGQLMRTGLAANATEAMDIITRGFQQGADQGGDFLDVINEYSSTFSELGVSGPQAVGLIDQALAAGIPNADFAADALREMGIIGREGGEAAAGALESLGLNAEDYFAAMQAGGPQAAGALDTVLDRLRSTEDPALRASAAAELVGTQYEDLGDAILQMDPSEAVDRLGQVEGATQRMGDTLNDNASTNLTSFSRGLQTAFVDIIGGQVVPMVEFIASLLTTLLGPAIDLVSAAVTGYVIPAFQSMARFVSDNAVPIGIIAGLIAAVFIPHLIALGVQSTIAGAKAAAGWVVTQAGAIQAAAAHSLSVVRMVAGWILMGVTSVAQGIVMAGAWLVGVITPAAVAVASFVVSVASIVAGWALMGVQSLIRAAQMAAAWVIAMGPIGWIIAAVVGLVALIIANWDKVKAWTIGAFQAVWDFIKGAWNGIVGAISGAITTAISFVSGLPSRILSALGNFGALLLQKGRDLIQGLVDGISGAASYVGNLAVNIVNAVIGFINDNIIDGINGLLDFTIMGIHVNPPDIPHIPKLHMGGVFTADGEGLALLRDQERVITPEQRVIADNLLGDLISGTLAAGTAAAGQAGGVHVENHITQQPGEDGTTLAARVTQRTVWNLNTGITRRVGSGAEAFA